MTIPKRMRPRRILFSFVELCYGKMAMAAALSGSRNTWMSA